MKEWATSSQAMRTGVKERTRSMIRLGVIDTSVKRKTVIKEIASYIFGNAGINMEFMGRKVVYLIMLQLASETDENGLRDT
ncbi:hypothetical protein OUZ56_033909 [Daphnia magna]|uniref:Uncharacterized protein n=1 Tax=Daphnia magna TaxID=35525 RepID=A0ABQ9ZYD5_9CRUS|nr:hypothetical protein OUZ56_033909 [Daphnia magna]